MLFFPRSCRVCFYRNLGLFFINFLFTSLLRSGQKWGLATPTPGRRAAIHLGAGLRGGEVTHGSIRRGAAPSAGGNAGLKARVIAIRITLSTNCGPNEPETDTPMQIRECILVLARTRSHYILTSPYITLLVYHRV